MFALKEIYKWKDDEIDFDVGTKNTTKESNGLQSYGSSSRHQLITISIESEYGMMQCLNYNIK